MCFRTAGRTLHLWHSIDQALVADHHRNSWHASTAQGPCASRMQAANKPETSTGSMEPAQGTALPPLDRDSARRIMSYMSQSEVISISKTCKAFWELSCGASRLRCSLPAAAHPEQADISFRKFIQKRCEGGMEVSYIASLMSILGQRARSIPASIRW